MGIFKSNWTKWILDGEDMIYKKHVFNPFLGIDYEKTVCVDRLKKTNTKTGDIKYKFIEK